MKATLIRRYKPECTTGILTVYEKDKIVFKCKTLELPNLDNQRQISCIPIGDYYIVPHKSPKFGDCVKVSDVIGRSDILIHTGNTTADTTGCILVGKDIDENNFLSASRITMNEFLKVLIQQTLLVIR